MINWKYVKDDNIESFFDCKYKIKDSICYSGAENNKLLIYFLNGEYYEYKFLLMNKKKLFVESGILSKLSKNIKVFIKMDACSKTSTIHYNDGDCLILLCQIHSNGALRTVINIIFSIILSRLKYVPAHGALVEINGKNIAIIGAHNSGKSTLILELQRNKNNFKTFSIITDDWFVFKIHQDNIWCFTTEFLLSFNKDMISKNDILLLEKDMSISLGSKILFDNSDMLFKLCQLDIVFILSENKNIYQELIGINNYYPYNILVNDARNHFRDWRKLTQNILTLSGKKQSAKENIEMIMSIL